MIIEGLDPDDEQINNSATNTENIDSNVVPSSTNQPQGNSYFTHFEII